jgi:hypothetical protein
VGGRSNASPRAKRRFVLISSGVDLISEVTEEGANERPWMMWALPEDLAALLPPTILEAAAEIGYIQTLLETLGVRRDVATRWPQPLGFRIVSRLAERGRVAFALMVAPKDVKRAGRVRVPKHNACARRIEADEIRWALRAAGSYVAKRRAGR